MKLKIFLLVILLNFIGRVAFCQEEYRPNKIVPPSPTAASLGIYGDLPVGYYTGTPNISIPLYEIKTASHNLPIVLSYNSTGVRVSEDASWVGLGWALSAGGVITRSVRGLDDLSGNGFYMTGLLPPSDDEYNYSGTNTAADRSFWENLVRSSMDGDPDIFFFNFAGYTGKFILDKKINGGKIYTSEASGLKIEYISRYSDWKVTTENGYEYFFETKEYLEDCYSSGMFELTRLKGITPDLTPSGQRIISSWYLTKIKAPSGETIDFTYETAQSLSVINKSQTRYDLLSVIQQQPPAAINPTYNYYKPEFDLK